MPAGSGEAATRAWMAAVAVGLVAAAAVSLWQGRPDPDPRAVVRHFAGTALNGRCGSDGNPWPAGDPCADSRGYRFVLHRQGRFDVYLSRAVHGASSPGRTTGSGGAPTVR
jgi:hypothetical protein